MDWKGNVARDDEAHDKHVGATLSARALDVGEGLRLHADVAEAARLCSKGREERLKGPCPLCRVHACTPLLFFTYTRCDRNTTLL